MSFVNQIYYALLQRYTKNQEDRYADRENNIIHVTDFISPCEEKVALTLSGVKPPNQNLEDVGARLHGTILHEAIEKIIEEELHGLKFEKEYAIQYKGKKIVAHPDMLTKVGTTLIDLKTVNPYKFARIKTTGHVPVSHLLQMNLYAFILKKNGINVENINLEYISKAKQMVRGKGEKITVHDLDIMEFEMPTNIKYVKFALNYLKTVTRKMENGEPLLGVKETTAYWKKEFENLGLDPQMIEEENYEKWMCDYCDYRDMCPLLHPEKSATAEDGKEGEDAVVNDEELDM